MKNFPLNENWYDDDEKESIYKLVARKTVYDVDGFTTDYSWYKNMKSGENVFVFGDSDIYRPEDGDYDWTEENDEAAEEWFDNYRGFEDEEGWEYMR